jgi:hypothetical protein
MTQNSVYDEKQHSVSDLTSISLPKLRIADFNSEHISSRLSTNQV